MRRLLPLLLLVAAFALPACQGPNKTQRYRSLYRQAQGQIEDLRARLEEARARADALQANATVRPELVEKLERAVAERDRLLAALAEAEAQIRELATGSALPPELDRAVMDLAARHPELMTYNPDRGMVKFASDLTFAPGSAEVNADATEGLDRLAEILQRPFARNYEVRIVGHTDSVPITRPATRQRHPTNWHLSVHRAIAVKEALDAAGVSEKRMGVAGYGSQRPLVPHRTGPDGKPRPTEANRRVEIFLVPARAATAAAPAEVVPDSGSGTTPAAPRTPGPNAETEPAPEPVEGPEAFK